jgi:hypothetical protein
MMPKRWMILTAAMLGFLAAPVPVFALPVLLAQFTWDVQADPPGCDPVVDAGCGLSFFTLANASASYTLSSGNITVDGTPHVLGDIGVGGSEQVVVPDIPSLATVTFRFFFDGALREVGASLSCADPLAVDDPTGCDLQSTGDIFVPYTATAFIEFDDENPPAPVAVPEPSTLIFSAPAVLFLLSRLRKNAR